MRKMEKIPKLTKCKYINYLRSSKLNLAGLKKKPNVKINKTLNKRSMLKND